MLTLLLACDSAVEPAANDNAELLARLDAIEAELSTARLALSDAEDRIVELEDQVDVLIDDSVPDLPRYLTVDADADAVVFSGANVYINSGLGATNGNPADPVAAAGVVNGLGNLIIGYDEDSYDVEGIASDKGGSHNLVLGAYHSYASYGGLVSGFYNTVSDRYATISGGWFNTAAGPFASVSGGYFNIASGESAQVTGGHDNLAIEEATSISGGLENLADGPYASVSGGHLNTASGDAAVISGGVDGIATGPFAVVSGGVTNDASGEAATVSGGYDNIASGDASTVIGGIEELAEDEGDVLP